MSFESGPHTENVDGTDILRLSEMWEGGGGKGVRYRGSKGVSMYYTILTFQMFRGGTRIPFPPPNGSLPVHLLLHCMP